MNRSTSTLAKYLSVRLTISLPLNVLTGPSQDLVTSGTYFLAKFQDHLLAITADHCIPAKVDLSQSAILLGEGSFLPVIRCTRHQPKTLNDFGEPTQDEERDIAIFELDPVEFDNLRDKPVSVPLSLEGVTLPDFPVGTPLYVEGYPLKRSQPDSPARRITRTSNKVSGIFQGQDNSASTSDMTTLLNITFL